MPENVEPAQAMSDEAKAVIAKSEKVEPVEAEPQTVSGFEPYNEPQPFVAADPEHQPQPYVMAQDLDVDPDSEGYIAGVSDPKDVPGGEPSKAEAAKVKEAEVARVTDPNRDQPGSNPSPTQPVEPEFTLGASSDESVAKESEAPARKSASKSASKSVSK